MHLFSFLLHPPFSLHFLLDTSFFLRFLFFSHFLLFGEVTTIIFSSAFFDWPPLFSTMDVTVTLKDHLSRLIHIMCLSFGQGIRFFPLFVSHLVQEDFSDGKHPHT